MKESTTFSTNIIHVQGLKLLFNESVQGGLKETEAIEGCTVDATLSEYLHFINNVVYLAQVEYFKAEGLKTEMDKETVIAEVQQLRFSEVNKIHQAWVSYFFTK
jgi:hypothetical protein